MPKYFRAIRVFNIEAHKTEMRLVTFWSPEHLIHQLNVMYPNGWSSIYSDMVRHLGGQWGSENGVSKRF